MVTCLTNSAFIRDSRTFTNRGRILVVQEFEGADGSPEFLRTRTKEENFHQSEKIEAEKHLMEGLE